MKDYRLQLSNCDLRDLCIKNNWFTHGTSDQYEKMFEMNDNGTDVHTLAAIIWTCSDPKGDTLIDIVEKLTDASRYPLYLDALVQELETVNGYEAATVALIREIIATHPDAGKAYKLIME